MDGANIWEGGSRGLDGRVIPFLREALGWGCSDQMACILLLFRDCIRTMLKVKCCGYLIESVGASSHQRQLKSTSTVPLYLNRSHPYICMCSVRTLCSQHCVQP
jgi:hypothetical protein